MEGGYKGCPHRPYFYDSVKFVTSNMEFTLLFIKDNIIIFSGTSGFKGEAVTVFSLALERDIGVSYSLVWDL